MQKPYADPNCPQCHGEGWIYAPSMITLPGMRGGRDCDCTLDHHRRINMERVWHSLSSAKDIPGLRENTILPDLTSKNLWITAIEKALRRHLKALCYRKSHMWSARVWSDADILKAWLGTSYAQGHKIYDTELDSVRVNAMSIDELVEGYDLVIFKLGVKATPNKEAPTNLLEALYCRRHLGKPTWIVDQPDRPITHIEHRCYSDELSDLLQEWPHLSLTASGGIKVLNNGSTSTQKTVENQEPVRVDLEKAALAGLQPEPVSEADTVAAEVIDDILDDLEDPAAKFRNQMLQNEKKQQERTRKKKYARKSHKRFSK